MKKIVIVLTLLVCTFLVGFKIYFEYESDNYESSKEKTTYVVDNRYFTLVNDELVSFRVLDVQNGTSSVKPAIKIYGKCSISLCEVSAKVRVYDSKDKFLFSFEDEQITTLDTNEEFSFTGEIENDSHIFYSHVEVEFSGKSYDKPNEKNIFYTITFVYNNGSTNKTTYVRNNNTISKPTNPQLTNHIFTGWYIDESLKTEYDFSKPVTKNITLYAKYIVDYAKLTNIITTQIMKCNVVVYTKSYNKFLGITTSSTSGSGSGIIFYESNDYYYLITNNHVSVKTSGYDKVSHTIEDYLGNTYTGYLLHESATYDLAVLYFVKGKTKLDKIDLADSNPEVGEEIVALGQPKGQSNSITYGKVTSYLSGPKLDCSTYESNVKFTVLSFDAVINQGSSGGALLNMDLELVGINYAGQFDKDGNFVKGYSIPIDKVHEYLDKYIYKK